MFYPVVYNFSQPDFAQTYHYVSSGNVSIGTDFIFQFEPNILTSRIDRKVYDSYFSEYTKLAKDIIYPECLSSNILTEQFNLHLFFQEKTATAFGFSLDFNFELELDEEFVSLSAYTLYVELRTRFDLKHQHAMWLMSKYLGSRTLTKHFGTFQNEDEIIKALGYSSDVHLIQQFIGENCPLETVIRTPSGLQAFKTLS